MFHPHHFMLLPPSNVLPSQASATAAGSAQRIISTRAHGVLDYLIGALLIAAPWLLGFAHHRGAATWLPVVLGAGAMIYSLFTNYEFGLVRVLPMKLHLGLDFCSGLLLAASPWLFGFADSVWLPHVAFGIFEIGAALLTQKVPNILGRGEAITGPHLTLF